MRVRGGRDYLQGRGLVACDDLAPSDVGGERGGVFGAANLLLVLLLIPHLTVATALT